MVLASEAHQEVDGIDVVPALGGHGAQGVAGVFQRHLAAFEPVPGVVAVVVVRPEAEVEGHVDIDTELLPRLVGGEERRLGEHAAEVEEDGLDRGQGVRW